MAIVLAGQIQDVKCDTAVNPYWEPTTLVHEVLPVRSGIRRVAVFWLQSFYRDSEVRQIVADLREGLSQLRTCPIRIPCLLLERWQILSENL